MIFDGLPIEGKRVVVVDWTRLASKVVGCCCLTWASSCYEVALEMEFEASALPLRKCWA